MVKALFFNMLFIFSLSAIAFAEGEVNINELGKEKPRGYAPDNKSGREVRSFSLRSGMYFKGENLINAAPASNSSYFHFLDTDNYPKEQNNYLLPSKKKAILNKLTFNPNELLRNYSGR